MNRYLKKYYSARIIAPSLDIHIVINDEKSLEVVELALEMIRKSLPQPPEKAE